MSSPMLDEARRAVGVTGAEAPPAPRGAGLPALLSAALSAGAFGPLALLVAGRAALADRLSIDAAVVDDRAISLCGVALLTALVAALVFSRRRLTGVRLVVAALLAIVVNPLLAVGGDITGLSLVAVGGGIAAALAWGTLRPALSDRLTPGARVGGLRAVTAGPPLALAVAGVGVWLGALDIAAYVLALFALVGSGAAWRFRGNDQAVDEQLVRATVHDEPTVEPSLPLGQAARRLLSRDTFGRTGGLNVVTGILVLPLPLFLLFHLDDRFGTVGGDGALVLGIAGSAAVLVLALGTKATAHAYAADPGRPAHRAARILGISAVLLAVLAVIGNEVAVVVLAASAIGMAWGAAARVDLVLFATLSQRLRDLASQITTAYLALGALLGVTVMAALDRRFGTAWAIGLPVIAFVAVVPGLRRIARTASADLDRTLDHAIGTEEIAARRRAGETVPLLECHGIDFSYGQVQVLFDVDFTVSEGEMVALLGTNGAGKSTLLRVVSGLGLPQAGSVRFDGQDVTFAAPGDRVRAGITQVPGGKAVFGPLSVVENLRVYGYALGTDKAVIDRGIEQAFEVFPRLSERRNQTAQTLSGGEQQMLALSKALILQPRLLLIDELSLGLAPKIVAQLLDMVREINRRGTAIVLVEQSVNVALSLVEHAYYMEKGEVRFDGRAAGLLERPDILRSVYLKGAAEGLGSGA